MGNDAGDCDLADWICLSGGNTSAPYLYGVRIRFVVPGLAPSEYTDATLNRIANTISALAGVVPSDVSIVVETDTYDDNFGGNLYVNITVQTPDTLRSDVVVNSFGDSLANQHTASAFFGITVRTAPTVTIYAPSGAAPAPPYGVTVAVDSNYFGGDPVKVGWILFAVLVAIGSLSLCCCMQGWGEKRLRDMDMLRRDDRIKLSNTAFFSVVDARKA